MSQQKGTLYIIGIAAAVTALFAASTVVAATPQSNIFGSVSCTGADCDFYDLVDLAGIVIDFIVFVLVTPFAAIMFAVAGWKMMTAGDNASQVQEAKTIFKYVAIGLVIAVGAWLLVDALLDGLKVGSNFNLL